MAELVDLARNEAQLPRVGVGRDLGLVTRGDTRSWATFSPCDRYRYVLARFWEPYFIGAREVSSLSGALVACLLNPSTADHQDDDPTVRKLVHYAKREGCGGLVLVNAAALRSTDPKELVRAADRGEDIEGLYNAEVIRRCLHFTSPILVGWGRMPSPRLGWLATSAAAHFAGADFGFTVDPKTREPVAGAVWCLGTNQDSSPKHPLYLRNDAPLVPWPPRST